jgi:hypothetical protein
MVWLSLISATAGSAGWLLAALVLVVLGALCACAPRERGGAKGGGATRERCTEHRAARETRTRDSGEKFKQYYRNAPQAPKEAPIMFSPFDARLIPHWGKLFSVKLLFLFTLANTHFCFKSISACVSKIYRDDTAFENKFPYFHSFAVKEFMCR